MKKYSIDLKTVTEQLDTLKELRCIVGYQTLLMDDGEKAMMVADGLEVMLDNIKEGLSSDGQIIITRK